MALSDGTRDDRAHPDRGSGSRNARRGPLPSTPKPKGGAAGSSPIRIDEIYPLVEFQRRTGLGRNGLRAARRRGLPVSKCGRNRYVAGADWAEFLQTQRSSAHTDK
jgi:hypothetical protein